MTNHPQLAVDEELFLRMVAVLAEMEGGDDKYEISTAAHGAFRDETVAFIFEERTAAKLSGDALDAADTYFAGLYTPRHHNLYFEGIPQQLDALDDAVADGVRLIVWAFMTAWTQRYGGISSDLKVRGRAFIDPALHDPQP